jgi:hypothetical protein
MRHGEGSVADSGTCSCRLSQQSLLTGAFLRCRTYRHCARYLRGSTELPGRSTGRCPLRRCDHVARFRVPVPPYMGAAAPGARCRVRVLNENRDVGRRTVSVCTIRNSGGARTRSSAHHDREGLSSIDRVADGSVTEIDDLHPPHRKLALAGEHCATLYARKAVNH